MSDLTAKFAALQEQLAAQETAANADRDATNTKLDAIFNELDTIIINNAVNTKALMQAISQSAACFPCPTPTIVVPPLDTSDLTVDEDHCKRAQAFIATIHSILAAMDTLQSFNVVGTFNVLNDAISEVISAVAAGDTVPLPSFPETVNIVGDYVSYAGERLFSGVGLVEQFSPLESDLLAALYAATTSEAESAAYGSFMDAASISNGAKLLFKAVAYSALVNYFFDPTTMPDLSAYDGTICAPAGECANYTSEVGGGGFEIVHWGDVYSDPSHTAGNWDGYRFRVVSNSTGEDLSCTFYTPEGSYGGLVIPGTYLSVADTFVTVDGPTAAVGIYSRFPGSGVVFVIEVCPPGAF